MTTTTTIIVAHQHFAPPAYEPPKNGQPGPDITEPFGAMHFYRMNDAGTGPYGGLSCACSGKVVVDLEQSAQDMIFLAFAERGHVAIVNSFGLAYTLKRVRNPQHAKEILADLTTEIVKIIEPGFPGAQVQFLGVSQFVRVPISVGVPR